MTMSNFNQAAKGAYAQPKLTIYGGFSQLTAAGSTGTNEQVSGQGSLTMMA